MDFNQFHNSDYIGTVRICIIYYIYSLSVSTADRLSRPCTCTYQMGAIYIRLLIIISRSWEAAKSKQNVYCNKRSVSYYIYFIILRIIMRIYIEATYISTKTPHVKRSKDLIYSYIMTLLSTIKYIDIVRFSFSRTSSTSTRRARIMRRDTYHLRLYTFLITAIWICNIDIEPRLRRQYIKT